MSETYVEFKELRSVWYLKLSYKYSYLYFKHFMYFSEAPNSLIFMVEVIDEGLEVKGSVILARGKEYSMALTKRPLYHHDRLIQGMEKKEENYLHTVLHRAQAALSYLVLIWGLDQ